VNFHRQVIVASFAFKKSRVKTVVFNPRGTHLAAAVGRSIQIWRVPLLNPITTQPERNSSSSSSSSSSSVTQHVPLTSLAFNPLILVREFQPSQDRITCINWSSDGKYVAWGSKDMTVYIERVKTKQKDHLRRKKHKDISSASPQRFTLTAHRDVLVLSAFTIINGRLYLVTLSKDALLVLWCWKADQMEDSSQNTSQPPSLDVGRLLSTSGNWIIEKKHLLRAHARIHTAQLHKPSNLLVVGFHNGYATAL
jgi:WD40 repeat protein